MLPYREGALLPILVFADVRDPAGEDPRRAAKPGRQGAETAEEQEQRDNRPKPGYAQPPPELHDRLHYAADQA